MTSVTHIRAYKCCFDAEAENRYENQRNKVAKGITGDHCVRFLDVFFVLLS